MAQTLSIDVMALHSGGTIIAAVAEVVKAMLLAGFATSPMLVQKFSILASAEYAEVALSEAKAAHDLTAESKRDGAHAVLE